MGCRSWRASLGAAVLAGSCICGVATASAALDAPPSDPSAPIEVASLPRLNFIQDLREIAAANPDVYAGVSTNGEESVTLHVVAGHDAGADAQRDLEELERAGSHVAVTHVAHSWAALESVQESIAGSVLAKLAGVHLQQWGIDPDSNTVQIGITEPVTAELTTALLNQFGSAARLRSVQRMYALSNRLTDTPNYSSGDRIVTGGGACTSAFTITNAYGTNYALTAGHCGYVGN